MSKDLGSRYSKFLEAWIKIQDKKTSPASDGTLKGGVAGLPEGYEHKIMSDDQLELGVIISNISSVDIGLD